MDKEEIQELIGVQKQVLKVIIEDDELRELNATNAKLSYDSYIAAGFTATDAINLVAASFKATK